jgi:quercetin dioxygenase-like cupin family protein
MTSQLVAVRAVDLDWVNADSLFDLPPGVEMRLLSEDLAVGRRDFLIKLPPGYVEPRHSHAGEHSVMILEGTIVVNHDDGSKVTLGPGDYVFGPAQLEHGPMEYPVGCVLFGSFRGDPLHLWPR